MKPLLNQIYQEPIPERLHRYLRDECGLNGDQKLVFDSLRNHEAESAFHYDNTGLPERKFNRALRSMAMTHAQRMLRLAAIGLAAQDAYKDGKL